MEPPEAALSGDALRSALERSADAVVCADGRGRIVYLNPSAQALFGLQPATAVGQELTVLMPPRYRDGHRRGFQRYQDTGVAHVIGKTLELEGRHQDGTEFPLELTIAEAGSGPARVFVAIIRDLRPRKAAEAQALAAREAEREVERLQEVNRFKTQFLNMAAHELLTPLTPLRTLMRVAAGNPLVTGDATLRRQFETINRNLARLVHLVQDLLDASRLDAGKLAIRRSEVDLNDVARNTIASFEEEARRGGIALEGRTDGELPVQGDPDRLAQVAFNLVSNAVKFTPAGGRVRVATRRDDAGAHLVVEDTGAGIDAEFLPQLFQPFNRAAQHEAQTLPGTGLGLYVSKGIVQSHGGTIRVESPGKGQGSTFTVTLPH